MSTPLAQLSFEVDGNTLSADLFSTSEAPPRICFLHGGGQSSRLRTRYLSEQLLQRGLGSLAFDYSGFGTSSGSIEEASLDRRLAEAVEAIRYLDQGAGIGIVGSSMSGHTAALLSNEFEVKGLALFCPAAYPAVAQSKRFGPEFRNAISTDWDFASSPAFTAIEAYRGKLLLVTGENDLVVPKAVVELYETSAKQASERRTIVLQDCPHAIHEWLPSRPQEKANVVGALVSVFSELCPRPSL